MKANLQIDLPQAQLLLASVRTALDLPEDDAPTRSEMRALTKLELRLEELVKRLTPKEAEEE